MSPTPAVPTASWVSHPPVFIVATSTPTSASRITARSASARVVASAALEPERVPTRAAASSARVPVFSIVWVPPYWPRIIAPRPRLRPVRPPSPNSLIVARPSAGQLRRLAFT